MNRALRLVLAICTGLLLWPSPLPAPINGPYPGIEPLIARSDAIVIARIVKRHNFLIPFWFYHPYEVVVEKSIKGPIPAGSRQTFGLWSLTYDDAQYDVFYYGTRHLIFLVHLPQPGTAIEYCNLNVKGSVGDWGPFHDDNPEPTTNMLEGVTMRGYATHTARVPLLVWLAAMGLGMLGLAAARWRWDALTRMSGGHLSALVLGGFLGVLIYALGLGLYARDPSTLQAGWSFLGLALAVVVVLGAPLCVIGWTVRRIIRIARRQRPTPPASQETR